MFNSSQMRLSASDSIESPTEGKVRSLNSELWHACAGPLVSLPMVGSRVVYLPQGHSEQVAASTQKEVDACIPNYPNLPPQLICQLHDVTLHADIETDEVYCQMTLQPVNTLEKESVLVPDLGSQNRQPNNFFCKTLTASDTSTHGGFSIPRRAAEKVFPPLDFSQTPPAQELLVKDLHDIEWKFRHIYRGQPKRHLLTTGWSVFVSAKRLTAGDSVLFIRNEKGQLLLGIRRANRPQTVMPSSVLSSDSMHIGILAAAAHAASTNSRFTVFYNPRASPSEFVIPFMKYEKAVYHTRVSVGMRFRMLFETEESSVRRYMGTITGIGDIDALRWPNSQWRSIKVGWDESTAGERQKRVSIWEIEPLTTFLLYPQLSNWRLRCPWPLPSGVELESVKKPPMWLGNHSGDNGFHALATQGTVMNSWGSLQHRYDSNIESDMYAALGAAALEEITTSKQLHIQPQSTHPEEMLYRPQSQLHHHPHYNLQQQQQLQPPLAQSQPMPVLQQQRPLPMQQRPNGLVLQQSQQLGPILQQQIQQHSLSKSNYSFSQQQTHGAHLDRMHQSIQSPLPNADGAITCLLSSQPTQVTLNSTVAAPLSTVSDCTAMLSSTAASHNSHLLQSILGSFTTGFTTDVNALQSNLMPATQPLRQQQPGVMLGSELHQQAVSTSWLPVPHVSGGQFLSGLQSDLADISRPISGAYVPTQTDVVELPLPKISAPALPSSVFGFGDRPQQQDGLQSNPHMQTHFGVNMDPPYTMPTSMWAGSKGFSADNEVQNPSVSHNEVQNPCVSQLMQGQSSVVGMELPFNPVMLNGGLDDSTVLEEIHALARANPPAARTYTKVYKHGSVGRSVDVTRFKNYAELRREVASLFGLGSQLEDPRSGWQLIFIDKEDDWLLLGDDPWEAFVSNVRYIKILCPSEIIEMQEGMGLQTGFPRIQRQTSSSSEDGSIQLDSRNPSSVLTSACSLEY